MHCGLGQCCVLPQGFSQPSLALTDICEDISLGGNKCWCFQPVLIRLPWGLWWGAVPGQGVCAQTTHPRDWTQILSLTHGPPSLTYGPPSLTHGPPPLTHGPPSLIHGPPSLLDELFISFLLDSFMLLPYFGFISVIFTCSFGWMVAPQRCVWLIIYSLDRLCVAGSWDSYRHRHIFVDTYGFVSLGWRLNSGVAELYNKVDSTFWDPDEPFFELIVLLCGSSRSL